MIKDIIISGLLNSAIYALLATGFSLVFGVARIMNFAHTTFYMLAAYLIYALNRTLGINILLSVVIAITMVALLAIASYRLFVDRIREHEMAVLMVTVALAFAVQESVILLFGGQYRGAPGFVSGYTELFGTRVTNQQLLAFGIAIAVLLGTWFLLQKSRLGLAIRAVSQDREAASLMGINVGVICTVTIAISAVLAGISGAIIVPLYVLEPYMWLHPLIMILAIVLLGGLGSIKGTLLASVILGFTETAVVYLIPSGTFLKSAFAFAVILIVLIIRPEGLFGVVFEEERL